MSTNKFIQDNIGETLLITLYMKCRESLKPNPIIRDKVACELVEKIDYDFSKFDKASNSSVGVAIRANYFDELTKAFIQKTDNPVIVIIGCGLDGRYERIGPSAKKATFYQLDIPEVMKIREEFIPSHPNETNIHSSMLETGWMDELKAKHKDNTILFIIEGIFIYFSKEDVKSVFENLASRFSDSEVLFDIINVWLSNNSHIHDSVKLMNTKFIYGTDDDKEMEQWANNLTLVSSKLYNDFPEWKRAGFKGWILSIIPKFRKAGRMLHYKIT